MLYYRSSSESNVDSARRNLFTQKNRPYDKIPPTRAALFQHVLRAAYQAGYIWGCSCCIPGWIHKALVPHARLPHPNEWKEGENGTLYVHWTDNNPIADVCHALKKCGCKNECSGRCTCNVPDSYVHHYAHARVNIDVLFFDGRYIVGAGQYVQML